MNVRDLDKMDQIIIGFAFQRSTYQYKQKSIDRPSAPGIPGRYDGERAWKRSSTNFQIIESGFSTNMENN